VVLDDWIDGTGYTPDQVLAALRSGQWAAIVDGGPRLPVPEWRPA